MTYEVQQDHDSCIGCEKCVYLCPDHWSMGDDGKSHLANGEPLEGKQGWEHAFYEDDASIECDKEAEDQCPVNVIFVTGH